MTTREEFNEEVYSIRANVGGHGNTKWSLECIIDYANTLEEELKALQQRSCGGCKYCTNVFSYTYPLCTKDEQYPFQIHNKEVLFCNRYEPKE